MILRDVSPFLESVEKRNPFEFAGALLQSTFKTFWGQFGWGTIVLPDPRQKHDE